MLKKTLNILVFVLSALLILIIVLGMYFSNVNYQIGYAECNKTLSPQLQNCLRRQSFYKKLSTGLNESLSECIVEKDILDDILEECKTDKDELNKTLSECLSGDICQTTTTQNIFITFEKTFYLFLVLLIPLTINLVNIKVGIEIKSKVIVFLVSIILLICILYILVDLGFV